MDVLGKDIPVYKKLLKHEGIAGRYHPRRKIEICSTLKGEELKVTVIHECGHAVLSRLGFENTGLPLELEELIVDNIAKVLVENNLIKIPKDFFEDE